MPSTPLPTTDTAVINIHSGEPIRGAMFRVSFASFMVSSRPAGLTGGSRCVIHCGQATPRNTLDAAKRILSVTSRVVVGNRVLATIQNNYHIHHYRPRSSPCLAPGRLGTPVEQDAQPGLVEHRHPERLRLVQLRAWVVAGD